MGVPPVRRAFVILFCVVLVVALGLALAQDQITLRLRQRACSRPVADNVKKDEKARRRRKRRSGSNRKMPGSARLNEARRDLYIPIAW